MRQFGLLFWIVWLIGFSACSDDDDSSKIDESQLDNRTILVYMAAQNSLSSFALSNFQGMLEGMASVDENNHLLVYLDTNVSGSLPEIIHLYKDAQQDVVVQETLYTYPEQDSSSVTIERMDDVFQRAFEAFPAESYGLILWSHGEGWLPESSALRSSRTFGQDGGSSGPKMELADLEEAISIGTTYLDGQQHFDFIYFDACFMQGVEVAYQLRNYTDYLIGCPLETPGPGAPYDLLMTPLFVSGEVDAIDIADTYFQYYNDKYDADVYGSNLNWTFGAAISVVETDALPDLADATRQLYAQYADVLSELTVDDLSSVQAFDYNRRYSGVYKHAYYDFGDFVRSFSTDEEYAAWEQQLSQAVVYAASTPTCYSAYCGVFTISAFSGLSTYVPFADEDYAAWNEAYASLDWTNAVY